MVWLQSYPALHGVLDLVSRCLRADLRSVVTFAVGPSLTKKLASVAVASLGLVTIVFLFIVHRLISHHLEKPSTHQTIPELHHLLSPQNASNHDLLTFRALPNARLVKAFALTNTFVSCDVGVHTTFVGRMMSLLKASTGREWSHFQNIAIDSVEEALPDTVDGKDFDVFIQDVTMRVALIAILGVDASAGELDSEDIRVVSSLITKLWSLSKRSEPIPAELLPLLNQHLRRLIPDESAFPNPLDFVIPVWETTWRVVATCVAYAQISSYGSDIFSKLHSSPTMDQFRHFDGSHPSVEWFITEAMRLHPPSQRIARAHSARPFHTFLPLGLGELITKFFGTFIRRGECADIGRALRSKCIWGMDADAFEPLRFKQVTREQEVIKTLPFGHGRLRCIAAGWAPMAAGIIAAAVLNCVCGGSDFHLVAGKCIGGREGWSGWSVIGAASSSSSRHPSEAKCNSEI